MATKIYYKEITDPDDGSKTKPVLIDDLFAVKKSLSEGDNVSKEKEVGIKEIGRDLSNLFQLIEDDTDKQYVPASYAELSHYNAEYKSSMKDLSEVFALNNANLITDETIKTKALSELASGVKGPVTEVPASGSGSVSSAPLSWYAVRYRVDVYLQSPNHTGLVRSYEIDSPLGSTKHTANTYNGIDGGGMWFQCYPLRFL